MEQNSMLELLSQLKPYSLGIALKNKEADTDMIDAFPCEQLFSVDGNIKDKIRARWLPLCNFNRRTAPDICQGQHVHLYRYADTPDYYWTTLLNEIGLQKAEHVIYSWSGVPANGKEAADADNSYWIMISPRDGKLHLHTSDTNGEAVKYDILIDTKAGRFSVSDSLDNSVSLNSVNGTLMADIKKAVIVKTEERIGLATKDTVISSERVTINAKDFFRVNAPIAYMPSMSVSGDIKQEGSIKSTGSHQAAGGHT